jgi:hypothetical protein
MDISLILLFPMLKQKENLYHDHYMVCKISSKLLPHGGALATPN